MTDFEVFKKTAAHILEALDQELSKLRNLITEELDPNSDRAGDVDTAAGKMQTQWLALKTAIGKLTEEDCEPYDEEEEDDEEEEEEEEEESE